MTIFYYLMAMGMGAVMSIYLPMIAQSARIMGAPVLGNLPFFAIALGTSVVMALATGQRPSALGKLADVPVWMLTAGILSALMIFGSSFLVPRIGTGALFVLLVAGQILVGMLINQYGLLGVPMQQASAIKLGGSVLVVAGAVLVTFGDAWFAK